MAPSITIRPVKYRPSPLSRPPSPPFTPRSPINRQVRRMKALPPVVSRAKKNSTITPLPWTWTCHMCSTRYPLGTTRRCLLDDHLFCSGTSPVRDPYAKLQVEFHGPGVYCPSAFDYKTWRKIGMEKEQGRESLRLRGLAGISGRGVMQKRDCWSKCWSPSECRHGRKAVEKALGIDVENELMTMDEMPTPTTVSCKKQDRHCSSEGDIGIAITLPELVPVPTPVVLISDAEEDERMRQEFEKLVDFDVPATTSIERPFSFAPIRVRKESYDSDSDSDSSTTSRDSNDSASTAPTSIDSSPNTSPNLSSAPLKPPTNKPSVPPVSEIPPTVPKKDYRTSAPRKSTNSLPSHPNTTRPKISAPIPTAKTIASANKLKCDAIPQPLISTTTDVKDFSSPNPPRTAYQESKSAAATTTPRHRLARRKRSISPKSRPRRLSSSLGSARPAHKSPPPSYDDSENTARVAAGARQFLRRGNGANGQEKDMYFVVSIDGVSPRETVVSEGVESGPMPTLRPQMGTKRIRKLPRTREHRGDRENSFFSRLRTGVTAS